MPAPDRLSGVRVVADPATIDAVVASLPAGTTSLRFAPDEVLVIGVTSVTLDDRDAIVVDEVGYVALTVEREVVARHIDWVLPAADEVAQGAIAGVPAKLAWLLDGRAWIVTHAAYAADLEARLR